MEFQGREPTNLTILIKYLPTKFARTQFSMRSKKFYCNKKLKQLDLTITIQFFPKINSTAQSLVLQRDKSLGLHHSLHQHRTDILFLAILTSVIPIIKDSKVSQREKFQNSHTVLRQQSVIQILMFLDQELMRLIKYLWTSKTLLVLWELIFEEIWRLKIQESIQALALTNMVSRCRQVSLIRKFCFWLIFSKVHRWKKENKNY